MKYAYIRYMHVNELCIMFVYNHLWVYRLISYARPWRITKVSLGFFSLSMPLTLKIIS